MSPYRAFPEGGTRLWPESRPDDQDDYRVISSDEKRVVAEAQRGALRHKHPGRGDVVILESGVSDAVYRLQARVETVVSTEVVHLVLVPLGPLDRVQRRRDFRVTKELPLTLRVNVGGSPRTLNPQAHDVSAGGIGIRLEHPLQIGAAGELTVRFPEEEFEFDCRAEVVRCLPLGDKNFHVGLKFTDVRPGDEDRLARILMEIARRKAQH